jgi:hypothetical protein
VRATRCTELSPALSLRFELGRDLAEELVAPALFDRRRQL